MAGESYGVGSHVHLDTGTDVISCNLQGRYLPLFASEIYDQNARLAEAGLAPVNLQSVMIGKFNWVSWQSAFPLRYLSAR